MSRSRLKPVRIGRHDAANQEIGEFVARARGLLNLSQIQLGEHLDLHQAGVSRIEAGKQEISLREAMILIGLLIVHGYGDEARIFLGLKKAPDAEPRAGKDPPPPIAG